MQYEERAPGRSEAAKRRIAFSVRRWHQRNACSLHLLLHLPRITLVDAIHPLGAMVPWRQAFFEMSWRRWQFWRAIYGPMN